MEALLLIVAELMTIPLFVATALLIEFTGGALIGVVQLLLSRGDRRPSRARRWWRRIVWTSTGVLGLLLATLVFIDLVLYEQGLRLLLDHVERRSGVDLCFERASGNIFTGEVHLEGVTIRHSNGAEVALNIDAVDIDVAMLRLLEPAVPITRLELRGVRGAITRRHAAPRGTRPGGRSFVIERLAISDMAIDFEDLAGTPLRSLPLAVDDLELAPLRSDHALVDLLCHTRASGRARGVSFAAEPGRWRAWDISLASAAARLGPAGKWLRGGQLDLAVVCPAEDADPFDLRVEVGLSRLQFVPPSDSGRRGLVTRVAAAIERLGPRVELQLVVSLSRGELVGVTSAAQINLWDRGVHEYNHQLGQRLGLDKDDLSLFGVGSRALEGFQQLRQRDR